MLSAKLIKKLFKALDEELRERGVKGEICICGGAAMCLVFNARDATKDVDGIFEPTSEIREASAVVAEKLDVPEDWLNDAAKVCFCGEPPKEDVLDLPNLRICAPSADYLLAMKCISARYDTQDKDDVVFLVEFLALKSSKQVLEIVRKYYPDFMVMDKTKFFLEELLGQ
jgi:hypothetical protein